MSDSSTPTATSHRSHARGDAVTKKILDVARDVLIGGGYANFTMESVAQAAGVSRSTLYRRWSSKQELVLACAQTLDVKSLRTDDQGSFAADVRHLIMARLQLVSTGAYAASQAAILAAVAEVPALREQVVAANLLKLQVTEDIIRRGRRRGDVRGDVDISVLRLLVSAPLLFSVLQLDEDPDQVYVDALVSLICRAAAPDSGGTC